MRPGLFSSWRALWRTVALWALLSFALGVLALCASELAHASCPEIAFVVDPGRLAFSAPTLWGWHLFDLSDPSARYPFRRGVGPATLDLPAGWYMLVASVEGNLCLHPVYVPLWDLDPERLTSADWERIRALLSQGAIQ